MIYAITLILLALSTVACSRVAPQPAEGGITPTPAAPLESCDPQLAALFAPRHSQWGDYEVCTAPGPVEPASSDGFSYAAVERLEALDAFGASGGYDRSRLAQLYGGRRVQVVRGWREREGRFESVTRLSPYPDASLTRLEDGTMIVRWIAER